MEEESINAKQIYRDFNSKTKLTETQISQATSIDELSQIRNNIQLISDFFTPDILASIPSFDQKHYTTHLDKLIEHVESKKAAMRSSDQQTKRRFTFKRKTGATPKTSSDTSDGLADSKTATAPLSNVNTVTPYASNVSNRTLILTPSSTGTKTLYISTISDNSTIVVTEPFDSIHISNCSDSTLQLLSNTSVFIDSAQRCVIAARCLQLRIHNTSNSKLLVNHADADKTLQAVIENCIDLQVGNWNETGEGFEINDFQNPNKTKKNPNYDLMTPKTLQETREQVRRVTEKEPDSS